MIFSLLYQVFITFIDEVGQTETHAPHPVQSLSFIFGLATPPACSENVMAIGSHRSPQLRHSTFLYAKQESFIFAFAVQGFSSIPLNIGSGQISAHR
jgi:hypothetical protein